MRAAILCYCWRNGEDAAHPMGVLPTDERLETVDSEGLNDVQTVFGEEQESMVGHRSQYQTGRAA
jgi:hypothetical protein